MCGWKERAGEQITSLFLFAIVKTFISPQLSFLRLNVNHYFCSPGSGLNLMSLPLKLFEMLLNLILPWKRTYLIIYHLLLIVLGFFALVAQTLRLSFERICLLPVHLHSFLAKKFKLLLLGLVCPSSVSSLSPFQPYQTVIVNPSCLTLFYLSDQVPCLCLLRHTHW